MILILIPALNPDEKLINLIKELVDTGYQEIVVVNDGSKSSSTEIFEEVKFLGAAVTSHCTNLGKGRAIKTGINYILNNYPECTGVVTVDADGQHRIADIQKCADKLEEKHKDNSIILGCRQFVNQADVKVPFRSRLGNICTRYILRYLCNLHVIDSQTGLRGIPFHLLSRLMTISGERYEYEMNMLLDLADEGTNFVEVPIETVYEDNNSISHFNPLADSVKIYTVIIKYSMASLLSAVLDNLTFALLTLSPYHMSIWAMTFIGRTISAIFNFSINKKVVFKRSEGLWGQAFRYVCLLIISGSISAFFVNAMHAAFAINIILVKLIVETILYFVNFYVQKNFVFARKGEKINAN